METTHRYLRAYLRVEFIGMIVLTLLAVIAGVVAGQWVFAALFAVVTLFFAFLTRRYHSSRQE